MNWLWILLVGGLLGGAVRALFMAPYLFKIRISDGSARVIEGTVTRDFVQQFAQICGDFGLKNGWVGCVRRGRRVALVFSRNVPRDCQQQVRNLWTNCS